MQRWFAAKPDSLTEVSAINQTPLVMIARRELQKLLPSAVGVPLYDNQFLVDTLHLPIAFQGLDCMGNESNLSSCPQGTVCLECFKELNREPYIGCTTARDAVAVSCEGKLPFKATKQFTMAITALAVKCI